MKVKGYLKIHTKGSSLVVSMCKFVGLGLGFKSRKSVSCDYKTWSKIKEKNQKKPNRVVIEAAWHVIQALIPEKLKWVKLLLLTSL